MKKSRAFPIILTVAVISLAGCGAINEQAPTSQASNDDNNNFSTNEFSDNSNFSASSDISINSESTSVSTTESSVVSSEVSSSEETNDSEPKTDANSENITTGKYTAEDLDRMYSNYIQAELSYTDISMISIMGEFYDGIYWIDTFMDNSSDSTHPVKAGSAYIDPSTGQGKFWIWGSYDDSDAVDVDFSKYDY